MKDFFSSIFGDLDAFEIIIFVILVVGVASSLLGLGNHYYNQWLPFFNALPFYLINFYSKYVMFAVLLSFIFFILVIIYTMREKEIRSKLMAKALPVTGEIKSKNESAPLINPKWKLVEEHIASEDANKWKLAILEADIILSELLDTLSLKGESIGEKLKNVEASDFFHIEEAWEAHKIRNAIAHQGSDFLLTQREAKRVVELYRSVFAEFEII